MGKSILVYVTANDSRVLGGDPLTLLIRDKKEQEETVTELARALKADVVHLKNGDYLMIGHD
jgi:siroheme synthase